MAQTLTGTEHYLAAFAGRETLAAEPPWLSDLRQAAIAAFAARGFPATREEAWRYTNVAPIASAAFEPARDGAAARVGARALAPHCLGDGSWIRLVFVNGRHVPGLSAPGKLPRAVRVGSLADVLRTDADLVRPHLAPDGGDEDAFAALNTAFFADGAFIHLPAGTAVEPPIHLLFVAAAPEAGRRVLVTPRTLIVAERGSRATIVEHHVPLARDVYLTSAVTTVVAGDGAVLDHHKLQQESEAAFHVGTLRARLGRDASLTSSSIALGGALARNTLRVALGAEGASCTLDGLYVLDGRQQVDNHLTVDHATPHGTSRQLYKGILDGKSRAVFNGHIIVRPGAQKTDAEQTNKNLLLADGPEVYSKPWLEIFADDVRCTHGAADGQLAEDAIFYLKSRGLPDETARAVLTYGFANAVLERVRLEPLRAHLDALVLARLHKGQATKETS